jgi:hypothetical protein
LAIRIINIILSLLILISSTGFTVISHFCQNQEKDVSVFFKADGCNKEITCKKDNKSCHAEKKSCENDCCNKVSDYYKLDQDQQLSSFEFKAFDNLKLIASLWIVLNFELPTIDNRSIQNFNYKPPLLFRDFPVVLQTFLI